MDPLALLCNLHADGPATLERLRQAGCNVLGDLQRLDPPKLAQLLDAAEGRSARFVREARLLAERIGPEPGAERVQETAGDPVREIEATDGLHPAGAADADPLAEHEREVVLSPAANRREHYALRPIKEAVLDVWRDRDAIDPPAEPVLRAPVVVDREQGEPLALGSLDGLDAHALAGLRRGGARSLQALALADSTALARSTGLPYSAVRRWQFLAARAMSRDEPAPAGGPAGAACAGGPFA